MNRNKVTECVVVEIDGHDGRPRFAIQNHQEPGVILIGGLSVGPMTDRNREEVQFYAMAPVAVGLLEDAAAELDDIAGAADGPIKARLVDLASKCHRVAGMRSIS